LTEASHIALDCYGSGEVSIFSHN